MEPSFFSSSIQGYDRYREHCERVIWVRPMSFELWQQIEPWLEERGRIAILDGLRYHQKRPRRYRGGVTVADCDARMLGREAAGMATIGA